MDQEEQMAEGKSRMEVSEEERTIIRKIREQKEIEAEADAKAAAAEVEPEAEVEDLSVPELPQVSPDLPPEAANKAVVNFVEDNGKPSPDTTEVWTELAQDFIDQGVVNAQISQLRTELAQTKLNRLLAREGLISTDINDTGWEHRVAQRRKTLDALVQIRYLMGPADGLVEHPPILDAEGASP
jgi:hypothetical protein